MGATTIRIRPASHQALRQIASITGQSMQDALDQAIEDRRRRLYLDGANADYHDLNRDPKALAQFTKEAEGSDRTNLDGLE